MAERLRAIRLAIIMPTILIIYYFSLDNFHALCEYSCMVSNEMTIKPARMLADAIGYIRETHKNSYSWTLTISDEEAIDILSAAIVKTERSN